MVGTGIGSNPKAEPCPAFGCILYNRKPDICICTVFKRSGIMIASRMDHSGTGQVWILDDYCINFPGD
jgi:hypothetical protein